MKMYSYVESGININTKKYQSLDVRKFNNFSLLKKNKCEFCGEGFRTLEQLMQHFQIKHDNKTYQCKQCNTKFEGMETMRDHIKKNHSYRK